MPTQSPLLTSHPSLWKLWFRLLTFRTRVDDYQAFNRNHLLAGLFVTWIVGMGRYWDDPKAEWLQLWGVGSVIYVFLLSAVFWIIVKPLEPKITYFNILTFITLTSPPAILYAIPVEKWMSLESANMLNLRFLQVVALWRLALLFRYLYYHTRLGWPAVFCCAMMPVSLIIWVLFELNLHHVVFNIMGGIRDADPSSQDAAYEALFLMGMLSFPVSCFCLLVWVGHLITRLVDPIRAARKKGSQRD